MLPSGSAVWLVGLKSGINEEGGNTTLQRTLGVSKGTFVQQVVPTIYSVAARMEFLDFQLRL